MRKLRLFVSFELRQACSPTSSIAPQRWPAFPAIVVRLLLGARARNFRFCEQRRSQAPLCLLFGTP
jgi:hypothetical protein